MITTETVVTLTWFLSVTAADKLGFVARFLGEIQGGNLKRLEPNVSQFIGCYNKECPSVSGFVGRREVSKLRMALRPTCPRRE